MQIDEKLGNRLLVVFDGECGFCSRAIRWFLKRDRKDRLRFASSQAAGKLLIGSPFHRTEGSSDTIPDTIFVVRDLGGREEKILIRSEAVLALLRELPQPWPIAAASMGRIPRPVLDSGYRLIARGRYWLGGRLQSCTIPSAEERSRFLVVS